MIIIIIHYYCCCCYSTVLAGACRADFTQNYSYRSRDLRESVQREQAGLKRQSGVGVGNGERLRRKRMRGGGLCLNRSDEAPVETGQVIRHRSRDCGG